MSTSRRRSVCLFGLSADPPTGQEGHVGIVQALQQLNEWDEIWVLPVYRHTFSDKRQRLVSFEHRMKMCELAFQNIEPLSNTKVVVSDAEYQSWKFAVRDIVNPDEKAKVSVGTASLLDYLSSLDAGSVTATSTEKEHDSTTTASNVMKTDYSFCLGADAFMDLTSGKWKESARVLQFFAAHKLVVLHRQTSASASTAAASATTKEASEKDSDTSLLERRVSATGARLIQVGQLGSISSSLVRECSSVSDLVTMVGPDVATYIQTHCLYQFANVNES